MWVESMIRILNGDCRSLLQTLDTGSVQCVVTSPPYFGLRDYGTGTWGGGDPDCQHSVGSQVQDNKASGAITTGQRPGVDASHCRKCGATRIDSQIGLEASPASYVAEMVAVFRELRRVLRDDGTVWLNLGDSYAGNSIGGFRPGCGRADGIVDERNQRNRNGNSCPSGFKPKDLMMIPARVAIALQDDGWYLRSQMPWLKRGCMPESVEDRPGNAVEYVYLLTKQPTYFYDAAAVKRVGTIQAGTRAAKGSNVRSALKDVNGRPPEYWEYNGTRNFRNSDLFFDSLSTPWGAISNNEGIIALDVNTQPFADAHFAVFPAALIEPLIKAGSRPGDTILDPFAGAFTTALAADRLGRDAIGIELSETYCAMARARLVNNARLEPLTPDDPLAHDKAALWSGADLPLFA